jgi:EXPERA (EXPanded EBP superfamily)
MTQAAFAHAAMQADDGTLPAKDKTIIVLIAFFSTVALTLEAYWLIYHDVMESRTDVFARLLAIYWPADYTYRVPGYPIEKCFILVAETVNTVVTPVLSFLLIWAILKRKPYRYPLQLTIGTYTFYGTFLYYAIAHVSGYVVFAYKSPYTYLMFYLVNLPWFIGYAWMAWDAFREIVRRQQKKT